MGNLAKITTLLLILALMLSLFYLRVINPRNTVAGYEIEENENKRIMEADVVSDDTIPTRKLAIVDTYRLDAGEEFKKDGNLTYERYFVELPLYAEDYYYGKYVNAKAATSEINSIPVLVPGDRIAVIGGGYLTLDKSKGYLQPGSKYYYASGVCWSISTLGMLMDEANKDFIEKHGIPLFIFENGDRIPHEHAYRTYTPSNNGYGYSVTKLKVGESFDYKFTVNPKIENIPELSGLEIKIVMNARDSHRTAYNGESIDAYILSNKKF